MLRFFVFLSSGIDLQSKFINIISNIAIFFCKYDFILRKSAFYKQVLIRFYTKLDSKSCLKYSL